MSNNHHQTPEPNNGTYQTGFTDRPKGSSGLIAVLLGLTIFLGGLASALGILNVQLLKQLMDQPEQTVPVSVNTTPSGSTDTTGDSLETDDTPAPELPERPTARLQLQDHTARYEAYGSLSAQEIYSRNEASLATVYCDSRDSGISGIGVVISSDGYILTNAHCVESAARIYVELADGSTCRAALAGTDALTDLAVIYIDRKDLTPAQFCDSSALADGDPIASAAALPEQDPKTLTGGFLGERYQVSLGSHSLSLLHTTVGSAQGPVFNHCGQIIGLSSGAAESCFDLYIQADTGFMIPSTTVKEVADCLIEFGFVPGRPSLGIRTAAITKVYQQYWDLPGGLQLLSVSQQAQDQGLRQGDILLSLDGKRLTENEDLHKLLLSRDLGQSLTAVVYREGERMNLTLTIFDLAV